FWSCLPAYFLSVLWIKPPGFFYVVGGVAALGQVLAMGLLVKILWPARAQLWVLFRGWSGLLIPLAAVSLALKTGMQLLTAFPAIAQLAYQIRLFIIGYLHLVVIGFVSLFLFSFYTQLGWLSFRKAASRWGMGLFLLAFAGTEGLLFLQGSFFWLM